MKTRLYTRKRALISSVAMLLVAMIALGTATFAWFTSNPNANATGLQLKATAAKGLVIKTESHNASWLHTDYLKYDADNQASSTTPFSLAATSLDLSGTQLGSATIVDAENDNSYLAKAGYEVSSAIEDTDYYTEKVYCKLNGTEESSDINMKSLELTVANNDSKLLSTIRVAIEYVDANGTELHEDEENPETVTGYAPKTTLIGVYALDTTKANGFLKGYDGSKAKNYLTSKPASETGTNYAEVKIDPSNTKFKTCSKVLGRITTYGNEATKLGTVDTTGNDYVNVTVYLDGQDTNCKTDNIEDASTIISNINLNLTVADLT